MQRAGDHEDEDVAIVYREGVVCKEPRDTRHRAAQHARALEAITDSPTPAPTPTTTTPPAEEKSYKEKAAETWAKAKAAAANVPLAAIAGGAAALVVIIAAALYRRHQHNKRLRTSGGKAADPIKIGAAAGALDFEFEQARVTV